MLTAIDKQLFELITGNLRTPLLTFLMQIITLSGSAGIVWLAVSAFLIKKSAYRNAGIAVLGGLLLSFVTVDLFLKPLTARERPWKTMNIETLGPRPGSSSFPSGHTATAFGAALPLVILLKKKRSLRAAILSYTLLMGFSRVYLGLHYPLDVLAGIAVGTLCGWAVTGVVLKLRSNGSCPDDPVPPTG